VVYATGEDVGFPLATALRVLGAARPRLVVRLEQPTYGRTLLRRTVFNTYLEYAAARIDRIVCRTAAHVQYLNSVSRIAERHLALVHETTDPAFYAPGADLALVAPAAKPFILAAGLEMRDYPTLIQAVRGQPMSLVIAAGSPWSHFGPGVTDVDQPPNVRVAAFKPLEMRALYRDADLVVVPVKPTLRACGMNVVLEAWAMGKAVIATRTAGLLDYIEDGREAVFVEPRDVEGLRAAIQSLLVQPETRRQLGEAGRQRVEADLNLDAYVQRITAILQNAAS
jgi:glycosyltransferase involved in cell wall biosynthesis